MKGGGSLRKVFLGIMALMLMIVLVAGIASLVAGKGFTPFGIGRETEDSLSNGENLTLPPLTVSLPAPESTKESTTTEESTIPVENTTGETSEETAAEATEESSEEATTEAVTDSSSEESTEAPTEAPTEPPTEAPTEPPTEAPTEPPTEAPTEPPTEAPTESPTEAPTEPPTEPPTDPPTETLPASLKAHLERAGMRADQLQGSQLIVVQAVEIPYCLLTCYQKTDSGWEEKAGLIDVTGKVGKKGVKPNSGWWSWYTPTGYFGLGPAYGRDAQVETGLEYHQILQGDYWIEDRDSKYYNRFYRDSWNDKDWYGAEDLYALLPYYYYMIVIQYNMDNPDPALDCAIFLHVGMMDSPEGSGGCVEADEWFMKAIFAWLQKGKDPHILIY